MAMSVEQQRVSHDEESCWNTDVEKARRLSHRVKKSSAVRECRCFKEELLLLSQLLPVSEEYFTLKEILNRYLTFDKKDFCIADNTVSQEEAGKFHAVVAGSYPAKLAGAVKRYGDVDIFVIVTDRTLGNLSSLWNALPARNTAADDVSYYNNMANILSVNNFGLVQIIVKYYPTGCLCDRHLNTDFFKDFHHCTRWKIDVFADLRLNVIRYMPLESGSDGSILCEETSLTLRYTKKVVRTNGKFRSKIVPARYPNKHATNILNNGPPTLEHQALHVLLRSRRNVDDDEKENC